ncbi:hypothetical protein GCM10025879_20450 [Leuconostoc litchii]|uniref:Uncharacterized protein n=1 Tax=Leuconostoc litchii TaxID=1981069 RepID=A0A6P2CMM6_9LACO|nr:hypothetical protein [Leuconostoc litchii]TYC46834.1 hypothetical protein ESZ47_01450 [Leuconostoc litchii]GMA70729.1 hypothetical protein GCM10025879_19750 [Leuconostoc litchii]GMA70799.1 hypothetical protein GCM10025879_20450 [Leuconostoc litchii]
MEQLIRLIKGLLDGEFELKEFTRSNKENDDNTTTMSFGFEVTKTTDQEVEEHIKEPTKENVITEANKLFLKASESISPEDIKNNPALINELAVLLDVILK